MYLFVDFCTEGQWVADVLVTVVASPVVTLTVP